MSDFMVSGTFDVITAQDLGEIAKGANMLPGAWTIDPVVDIRPPIRPCVWLHPAPPCTISMSFGVSKQNGIFWLRVRHHGEADPFTREGIPYASLGTAFASVGEALLMLRDDRREPGNLAGKWSWIRQYFVMARLAIVGSSSRTVIKYGLRLGRR
jgi:hypothetical protein